MWGFVGTDPVIWFSTDFTICTKMGARNRFLELEGGGYLLYSFGHVASLFNKYSDIHQVCNEMF